jgi:hypothetical protein
LKKASREFGITLTFFSTVSCSGTPLHYRGAFFVARVRRICLHFTCATGSISLNPDSPEDGSESILGNFGRSFKTMLRLSTLTLAFVSIVSFAGLGRADVTVHGPIIEVNPAKSMLVIRQPDDSPLQVFPAEDCRIVVNGQEAKLTDLAKDMKAAVTVVNLKKGEAVRIEIGNVQGPAPASGAAAPVSGSANSSSTNPGSSSGSSRSTPVSPAIIGGPFIVGPVFLPGHYRRYYVAPRQTPLMGRTRRY